MWKPLIFFLLSLVMIVPNWSSRHLQPQQAQRFSWEEFSPELAERLQSIDAVQAYCDSLRERFKIESGSLGHADLMAQVLRKRFYHGYSHYALGENWVAAMSGRLFWDHLSAIVLPEHILRYPFAACSQQEIVLMTLFERNKIPYRKVMFNHHFALEARFDEDWYFFDVNLEPTFPDHRRTSLDSIIRQNQLTAIYKDRMDVAKIDSILGPPRYGSLNEFPAPRARLFHEFTQWLSKWGWAISFGLGVFFWIKYRKQQQKKMDRF